MQLFTSFTDFRNANFQISFLSIYSRSLYIFGIRSHFCLLFQGKKNQKEININHVYHCLWTGQDKTLDLNMINDGDMIETQSPSRKKASVSHC